MNLTPDELAALRASADEVTREAVLALVAEVERLRRAWDDLNDQRVDAKNEAFDAVQRAGNADAEIVRLKARLAAAELVCVAYGISPARHDSDREKATHELWSDWQELAQADMTSLSDERITELARRRDAKRAEALRRSAQLMRSEEPS